MAKVADSNSRITNTKNMNQLLRRIALININSESQMNHKISIPKSTGNQNGTVTRVFRRWIYTAWNSG